MVRIGAHQGKTQQHRGPGRPVAEDTEHDAADRPRQETGAEGRQRQHQAWPYRYSREEGVADLGGKKL